MHPPKILCVLFGLISDLIPALASTVPTHILARSEVNGPCNGADQTPGICVLKDSCTRDGGSFISNACPGTAENIKCCTKPKCGTGNKGSCSFVSSCSSGITERNFCPGPSDFRCCMPSTDGTGGAGGGKVDPPGQGQGSQPELPTTSSGCKSVATNGAKTIIDAFPGQVKIIYCIRKCSDPDSSDHCTGMATDMMVNTSGEKVTTGQPIAEWVMRHHSELSLSYVMWGQRIWDVAVDSSEKPWEEWRYQACIKSHPNCVNGDRGDNTQNHWDHVHVSYR